jgi:hypothetical protein
LEGSDTDFAERDAAVMFGAQRDCNATLGDRHLNQLLDLMLFGAVD